MSSYKGFRSFAIMALACLPTRLPSPLCKDACRHGAKHPATEHVLCCTGLSQSGLLYYNNVLSLPMMVVTMLLMTTDVQQVIKLPQIREPMFLVILLHSLYILFLARNSTKKNGVSCHRCIKNFQMKILHLTLFILLTASAEIDQVLLHCRYFWCSRPRRPSF